jgi:hypothetical protein
VASSSSQRGYLYSETPHPSQIGYFPLALPGVGGGLLFGLCLLVASFCTGAVRTHLEGGAVEEDMAGWIGVLLLHGLKIRTTRSRRLPTTVTE